MFDAVQQAVCFLRARLSSEVQVAIVLGTGLGGVAENLEVAARIPYREIPHFPESTVEGHKGELVFGKLGGKSVLAMQGRFHYYEGYSLQQTTLPIRIMRALGCRFLLVNSAAGGLNPHFRAGDVMIVTDHINLMGDNPLRGVLDPRLGERFPDMSRPYDDELIRRAGEAAVERKIQVKYGVYAAVSGPNLETRAETRMLRLLGADAVGMSTVPEVIVASQIGFRTLALAAVTNVNLPDAMEPVSVETVIENAQLIQPKLGAITERVLERLS
ncbi:MAG TPA: purine-nucleoside phosphorylase [Desulfomonilaceae bacterium]|nr:purine-nucleoside phosphorylase [Desulfomonilaceae bacterium]